MARVRPGDRRPARRREFGADFVRAERDEREEVASVQRQLDDASVLDDRADRRVSVVMSGATPVTCAVSESAPTGVSVCTDGLLDVQLDVSLDRLEALQLDALPDKGPGGSAG